MSETWFWSDLHIGHKNLCEKWRLGPGFDGTIPTHTEVVVERWNAVVGKNDTVVVVGDAVMGIRVENLKNIDRMNGHKVLCPGNHDDAHQMFAGKPERHARSVELYGQYFEIVDPTIDGERFGLDGAIICHFPWFGTPDHEDSDRDHLDRWYPRREAFPAGTVLVHGHTHSKERLARDMVHVGVDAWADGPVHIDVVRDMISRARAWL